jgi:SDR family mycofactocin-dependent oxidoreductase
MLASLVATGPTRTNGSTAQEHWTRPTIDATLVTGDREGSDMGKLDGKVAYITGAARGQGRSHAVLLAEEGADIVGVDLCEDIDTCNYPLGTEEDLEETVRLVEKTGRTMVGRKADVRDRDALQAAVDVGMERFGRLDIVLANAGISNYQQAPYDQSVQAWQDTLDVCLTGVWNTLQVTVPSIVEGDRGGAIVITASTAGTRVSTTNFDGGFDAYTAAKHALVGLMRSYAGRLGRHRIRVNTIHPTTTETPLGRDDRYIGWAMSEHELMATEFNHALPIMSVDPIDISNGVLYLVSDMGRYVTGQTLHVDAGNATVALGGVAGTGPGGVQVSIAVEPPA